jgi:iron complex outermembrane receptor protein
MNPSNHPVGPCRLARPAGRPTTFATIVTRLLLLTALACASPALRAQATGTGTISGNVQNKVTGDFLVNARVILKGTTRSTLTDEGGYYTLTGVPAGPADLEAVHSGLTTGTATVSVDAGRVTVHDFALGSLTRRTDDVIVLDAFAVQATRETDAAAIAVNEQRVSRTQKSVISADQFGTIVDSNPGELLKWLPGVSVEYFANNIVGVSVRGLDAVNTAITFDGMPIASASTTTGDRNFEVLGASAADIARVEVRKLRTPEDSANALGGSLNLIRRSAFEASKRRLTYSLTFATDYEDFTLSERPGIRDNLQQGWRPNWKLTWTDPVSKTFGYAITLARSDTLARVHWSSPSWNYGSAAQATAAEALIAAGQPLTTVSVYNPARTQDLLHDNAKQDITDSGSIKLDWRPFPELKLSYSLAGSRYQERTGDDLRFTWNTGTPLSNGADFTRGTTGNGAIQYDMREAWRNGIKDVLTHTIDAEWRRGDWTVNARASYSGAKHEYRDTADGFFQSTTFVGSSIPNTGIGTGKANPRRITVNLLNRDFDFSRTIEAFDSVTGAPVDWTDLNNMYIGGAVSRPGNMDEKVGAVRLGVKHDFRFRNPFSLKLGFDFDETYRNRARYDANLWRFVGADHIAGTADDNAAQIAAVNVAPARDTYYDSPAVPRISLSRLYSLYQTHPDWFSLNAAESFQFSARDPYELDEKTYAGYLQATGNYFTNRLSYIAGVRYERSDAWGIGLLDRGSTVVPAGVPSTSLLAAQLRYVRKGARAEGSNDGWFPSGEIAWNFTDNLVLRAGYAKTQAKNRYQRSVIPAHTITFSAPTSGPFSGIAIGTINLRNPNLQPWTADNFEAHLEYYTAQGGVLSVGAYRKDISNNQVSTSILLDTPELLAGFDLDPNFLNFQATSWINQGIGRIDGYEVEFRQPLDVILPGFARGLTLTGSASSNKLSKFEYANGNISIDFQNFYETQYKVNVGYRRGKLLANVGLVRNGKVYRQRDDAVGHEGHRFYPPYSTVDFSLEYAVMKNAKLFLSGRNITNGLKTRLRVIDGAPEWSHLHIENNLGVVYQAGITGSF